MHTWFIVYTDGSTETVEAEDLDEIYRKIEKDVRSLMRID